LFTQVKGGLRSLTLPLRCCQCPRQRDCWTVAQRRAAL
jgi:hypothetical protein